MPGLLIALLAILTVATANATAFGLRAESVEQRLAAAQADGVPDGLLAPARAALAGEAARHDGPLPAAVVSGAVTSDPFRSAEALIDAAYRSALAASRQRAEMALARLGDASGPGLGAAISGAGAPQIATARTPAALDGLAAAWDARAGALEEIRQRLAATAGGLDGGLPADVVAQLGVLRGELGQAGQQNVGTADVAGAITRAQAYLAQGYPTMLAGHDAEIADLRAATNALGHRLDLRQRVAAMRGEIPGLLDQATAYGAGDDFKGRVSTVEGSVDAAQGSGDDTALDAALTDLQKLDDDLHAAAAGRLPTAGIACQTGTPDQLIVIHLATQQLVAFDKGCPMLRTPITTGRPALPTGRGTFHIFYKSPTYHMISPWPAGSAFYYPPTWVSDAMEFIGNGTFLHSASWQPDDSYGPDSEYGPYASHGCVHVIDAPLQQLYAWAAIGATVVVGD